MMIMKRNMEMKDLLDLHLSIPFSQNQTAQGSVVAETSSESSKAQDIPPVRKLEVEPGEGDSILAIVLINRGFSDVTSIRASLDFPSGFKALVTPKNTESDTAMATSMV